MNNGNIFSGDLSKKAVITGTDEAVKCPVSNIAADNPGLVWCSTAISQCEIRFTFPAATPIKGIALFNTNFETGDTITLQASGDDFASPPAQSQAIDPGQGFIEVEWNYRYYRLLVQKTTGSHMQIGKAFIFSQSYMFEECFNYGYSEGNENRFSETETQGGQVYRELLYSRYWFNGPFTFAPLSQVDAVQNAAKQAFTCFRAFADRPLRFGKIENSTPVCTGANRHEFSLTFTENPA